MPVGLSIPLGDTMQFLTTFDIQLNSMHLGTQPQGQFLMSLPCLQLRLGNVSLRILAFPTQTAEMAASPGIESWTANPSSLQTSKLTNTVDKQTSMVTCFSDIFRVKTNYLRACWSLCREPAASSRVPRPERTCRSSSSWRSSSMQQIMTRSNCTLYRDKIQWLVNAVEV